MAQISAQISNFHHGFATRAMRRVFADRIGATIGTI
jgi:hypothetical protein